MKKIYASLFVAALGAGAMFAETPQLTTVWTKTYDVKVGEFDETAPNWSNPTAIKATPGMKNATGIKGKLYGIDMTTMSVTSFDQNGYQKAFDLPSLEGQTISYTALTETGELTTGPDFYGSLITRDDAGNILVGHGFNTGACNNTWTVLNTATGATKRLVYDFGADYHACLPISVVGRAIGDVTKEGYLYPGPTSVYWPLIKEFEWAKVANNKHFDIQRTKMLKFSGNGTVDGTTLDGELSGYMPLSNWTYNICQPWYPGITAMKEAMEADPTMVTLNQTFFIASKLTGSCGMINVYGVAFGILNPEKANSLMSPYDLSGTNSELFGMNYSLYDGFDTFELDGNRYYVATYTEDAEDKNEGLLTFAIFDEAGYLCYDSEGKNAKELVMTFDVPWSDPGTDALLGNTFLPVGSYNINVEYVDDKNVNIYVWAQCQENGVFAGMFNFGYGKTDPSGSGVEDVVAEANEAPVYYNLNGIRVANPENGIFIKKCGNKVTKVVK